MTRHSLGFGPPPAGVKQFVLHCAPHTLVGVVVCRGFKSSGSLATCRVAVGHETVYTSTLLSFPIQVDSDRAEAVSTSQTLCSEGPPDARVNVARSETRVIIPRRIS